MNARFRTLGLVCVLLGAASALWAAGEVAGDPGIAGQAINAPPPPAAVQPFNPPGFSPPALPSLGAAPSFPSIPGLQPEASPGVAGVAEVPAPPPLPSLTGAIDVGTTGTTQTVAVPAAAQGPIESYAFLFREDPELGTVREKYTFDEAEKRKEQEIQRLLPKFQTAGGQQQQQGQDPRAGAEWDFYYEQLELYSRYVHERVLPETPDLAQPEYEPQNALQERLDLKAAFDKAAISYVNQQHEENLGFYDRLQAREDRRRAFYEWVASKQLELDEWAKVWARKVDGTMVTIEGREYLVSAEPLHRVAPHQLNVISSNLTPYDIIDHNGNLKTPEMERYRGTAVRAPYMVTTGTVELVP